MSEQFVIVRFDYVAVGPDELSIKKNERLRLIDDKLQWWKVANEKNETGFVPSNFVCRENGENCNDENVSSAVMMNGSNESKSTHNNCTVSLEKKINKPSQMIDNRSDGNKGIALYNYEPARDDELALTKNELVTIIEKMEDGWWKGKVSGGKVGWFPSNYVNEVTEDAISPGRVIIEIVVAMYSFIAQNSEELSFNKNEQLEILEHPNHDPEWWLARNSRFEIGLVPINYIKVVEKNPSKGIFHIIGLGKSESSGSEKVVAKTPKNELSDMPFYFGNIARDATEQHLNSRGVNGDFLVRDSETNVGDYSISLKGETRNKHFRVQVDKNTGSYKIGSRTFPNIEELIEFYKVHPIFSSDNGIEKLFLVKPFPKKESS
uniref:Cytoplasmic protein NCK1 n=1 Tax=Rhabditophanes sp. KR3021 TaxID=114890 RepID=A0AC35TP39_9BILA